MGSNIPYYLLALAKCRLYLLAFLLSAPFSHGQDLTHKELFLPQIAPGQVVVRHMAYSLLYDEDHEQARWVAYELTATEVSGSVERESSFMTDPMVATFTAVDDDYKGSGFDRGHLAPAADMAWSEQSMRESFYFSNISPQVPSFNRGIWKQLEELVRYWAEIYGSVQVVTGPILKHGLTAIGTNRVSVPKQYYKALLVHTQKGYQCIGFILPNEGTDLSLSHFLASVDETESVTGLDFFPMLSDELELRIEQTVDPEDWVWSRNQQQPAHHPSLQQALDSRQCNGLTKAGERCKNITRSPSGLCHLHD